MSKRKLFELRGRQSVPGEDPSAPSVTISQAWLAPRQPITSMADLHYHPNSDHIMSASMIDGMDREHSEPPIDGQRSAQSSGQSVSPQSIVSQRQIPKCSKCRNHFVETPVKSESNLYHCISDQRKHDFITFLA